MTNLRVIFVLGGPGAGKGTQCGKIVDSFDFVHLSAGDLLREERNNPESEHGQLIQDYIKEGKIVPVEITVALLLRAMESSGRHNFLVDGFPRNKDNLDGWNSVVGSKAEVLGVLFFDCPESVMEARLLERGKTSGRADDNAASIRKRFHTYMNDTMPIINHFGGENKSWRIVSDRPVDAIFEEVSQIVPRMLGGQVKPKVIFVLGGPGAGKGTQCGKIVDSFDFVHLSAGDLLREERNNPESEHGQLIQDYIKEGKIVPVEITVALLLRAMQSSGRHNFLVDGFPRNKDNLDGWNSVVGSKAEVLGVLFFDCPESVMEARLLERGKTSGRADDNAASIRKRFHTYMNDTMPIINHFGRENKSWRIVSDRPVDAIFKEVSQVVPEMLGGGSGNYSGSGVTMQAVRQRLDSVMDSAIDSAAEVAAAVRSAPRRNLAIVGLGCVSVALGCVFWKRAGANSTETSSRRSL
jgi:UMP-CMP kinase family protein